LNGALGDAIAVGEGVDRNPILIVNRLHCEP
jgi:hypothetical protein